ncbi:MAG TPA: CARDB domain-containing protein [Pyrinomonadaceae bacterium]|nr:CARDB domain-containing protein [Pyrinomonadaceae bacterium]
MKKIICLCFIAVCALQVALASNSGFKDNVEHKSVAVNLTPPMPDLIVRGNEFEFAGNKTVNVYVSNNGDAPSKRCILELTVRKIGDAAVGRTKRATIPVIEPGKFVKIPVDASSILPNAVNLKDTTFKVIADATKLNAESNEDNNEKWHNLP